MSQVEDLLKQLEALQLQLATKDLQLANQEKQLANQERRTYPVFPAIRDGLPRLKQIIISSGPSIPPESKHKRCSIEIENSFYLYKVEDSIWNSSNYLWAELNTEEKKRHNILTFTNEATIVIYVRTFLLQIIQAMKLEFEIAIDFGIKSIMPDICILTIAHRIIGVVEVKKPGIDILNQPTVLGELFDQLL